MGFSAKGVSVEPEAGPGGYVNVGNRGRSGEPNLENGWVGGFVHVGVLRVVVSANVCHNPRLFQG